MSLVRWSNVAHSDRARWAAPPPLVLKGVLRARGQSGCGAWWRPAGTVGCASRRGPVSACAFNVRLRPRRRLGHVPGPDAEPSRRARGRRALNSAPTHQRQASTLPARPFSDSRASRALGSARKCSRRPGGRAASWLEPGTAPVQPRGARASSRSSRCSPAVERHLQRRGLRAPRRGARTTAPFRLPARMQGRPPASRQLRRR
jgi:hypothetical protein